jgi:site-specific recombinase XerD
MFRHACGFQLANQGTDTRTLQAYLGHRALHRP